MKKKISGVMRLSRVFVNILCDYWHQIFAGFPANSSPNLSMPLDASRPPFDAKFLGVDRTSNCSYG
jgi:hypothetical protein